MKIILFLFFLMSLTLACAQLPSDVHPNPAKFGYHRMEFDTFGLDKKEKKEIGVSNFYLFEDKDLSGMYFVFHGIRQGTVYLKSNACGIDVTLPYTRNSKFFLSDLVSKPTKCSIKMTAEASEIKRRHHNIVETGVVKINVLPEKSHPIKMKYHRTNSVPVQEYVYVGQGSMQRQEGDLTSQEEVTFATDSNGGGFYRIIGCGGASVLSSTYEGNEFTVTLKDIYNKNYLERTDTCDFEVIAIPNEERFKYLGRFSVNIYGKDAVKLEPLFFDIYKSWGRWKIKAWGRSYITGCSINNYQWIKKRCSLRYYNDQLYWIRAFTSNGRKSLYGVKNNEIVWRE